MTPTTENPSESTTTFRIRLSPTDVASLKELARRESVRRNVDLGWCDLVRAAIRKMARDGVAIG
jgi:hypothetical protein